MVLPLSRLVLCCRCGTRACELRVPRSLSATMLHFGLLGLRPPERHKKRGLAIWLLKTHNSRPINPCYWPFSKSSTKKICDCASWRRRIRRTCQSILIHSAESFLEIPKKWNHCHHQHTCTHTQGPALRARTSFVFKCKIMASTCGISVWPSSYPTPPPSKMAWSM